jgi:class 3 adenylate cyclase
MPVETAAFGLWGRSVNVAQRLCDLAGPGEIQIGPAAYAAAGPHVGRATPVRAWLNGIAGTVVAHRMIVPRSGVA